MLLAIMIVSLMTGNYIQAVAQLMERIVQRRVAGEKYRPHYNRHYDEDHTYLNKSV
jgi:hypothetical protein